MLLNIFRKKKTLEKLYEKYENLRIEAFHFEKTDKERSKKLLEEAKKISDEIDRFKQENKINTLI
ncbi:MAG: Lacal_2735 family protein [Thermaurantimonas sp.]